MLSQAGVALVERDLIRQPLSEAEIRSLLGGRPASLLYSRRSPQNRTLGIEPERLSADEMIAYMAREPRLIRRPTLVVDGELIPGPTRAQLEDIARSASGNAPLG